MQNKRRKIILITTFLLCVVGSTGCEGPYYPILKDEYDAVLHNDIIGKWKLVRKSIHSSDGYTDDVEDCSITFTKIENNMYGHYTSNIFPDDLYYVVTKQTDIFFIIH